MKALKGALQAVAFSIGVVLTLTGCSLYRDADSSPSPDPTQVRLPVLVPDWKPLASNEQQTLLVTDRRKLEYAEGEVSGFHYCNAVLGGQVTTTEVSSRSYRAIYSTGGEENKSGKEYKTPYPIDAPFCEEGATVVLDDTSKSLEDVAVYDRYVDQSKRANEQPVKNPVTRMVGSDMSMLEKGDKLMIPARKTNAVGPVERCKIRQGDLLTPIATSKKGDVTVVRRASNGCIKDVATVDLLMSSDALAALDGNFERTLSDARKKIGALVDPQLVKETVAVEVGPFAGGAKCYLQPNGVVEVLMTHDQFTVIHYLAPSQATTAAACANDLVAITRSEAWYKPRPMPVIPPTDQGK